MSAFLEKITEILAAAKIMAESIAASGMFGAKSPHQGLVIALHCLQTETPLLTFQREYHLIDGKPSMKAEAVLAKFNQSGGKHRWIKDGSDGVEAVIELTYDGQAIQSKYTMDDARKALVAKKDSQWEKSPGNMLRSKAASNGVRMIHPGVMVGCYTPEEIADIPSDDDRPATAEVVTLTPEEKDAKKKATKAKVLPAATPVATSGAAVLAAIGATANVATEAATEAVATTAAETATDPASAATPDAKASPKQLELIVALKNELQIPDGTWTQVLERLNCPVDPVAKKRKISLGTQAQADMLIDWMNTEKAKRPALGKSLSDFGNAAGTKALAATA